MDTEWAAGTFPMPKKTGDIRTTMDFRELNKWLVCKPYPLPKIQDLLQKLEKFKYATALDLQRGYYSIPLSPRARKLCATVFPWGKYIYNVLPMGLSVSPDIFQWVMNSCLGDLEYVIVYLDNILILSSHDDTFQDHLHKIDTVLKRLEDYNFKVNLYKSVFMTNELDYLGYTLTPNGIKPQAKKVEAISHILPPKNTRQLRHFLGMVNYYRDMFRCRSHVLAPLTAIASSKKKFKWTNTEQKAFEEAKRMVAREALLAYPDFNKEFHVYSDASDYQLGGIIMQDEKPLAFYTRKLNKAQAKYSTGEQELLGIIETLKEFENVLYGQCIIVYMDHLNLLYSKLATNCLV